MHSKLITWPCFYEKNVSKVPGHSKFTKFLRSLLSSSSSSFQTGKTGKKSAAAMNHPGLKHLHPYPLSHALFRLPTPSFTFQSGDWVFDWGPEEEFC